MTNEQTAGESVEHFRVVYDRKVDGHKVDPRKFTSFADAGKVAGYARSVGIDARVRTMNPVRQVES